MYTYKNTSGTGFTWTNLLTSLPNFVQHNKTLPIHFGRILTMYYIVLHHEQ